MSEVPDNGRFEGLENSRFSRFFRFDGLNLLRSGELYDPRCPARRRVGVAKNPELGSSTVNLAVPPI